MILSTLFCLFFFKIVLAIVIPLPFYINFRFSLSICTKYPAESLIGVELYFVQKKVTIMGLILLSLEGLFAKWPLAGIWELDW